MSNKFLYLDFDGVLHPNAVTKGQLFSLMPTLTSVLINTDVRVVISSSWRRYESLEYLKSLFSPQIRDFVIGCTEDVKVDKWHRWYEIKQHVEKFNAYDWMALDDAFEMFPPNCENLILCDGSKGLQKAQLELLKQWISA